MKNKYKKNYDAIKYLSVLSEKEIQKPVEEMDCDLILSCSEILLKLQGKKVSLTEKEIDEKVRKISFAEGSGNVKEFTARKNVKTKTTQKRILLIAAVIAILVAILSFVSVAFEWDIHNIMKEKFGSVFNVPVGVEQNVNDLTFTNEGKNIKYKNIDELVENENLDILFPANLPNDITIERITISETSFGQIIDITFSDENLFFSITLDSDIPEGNKATCNQIITINSIDYYITNLTDVNTYIIEFVYNDNFYSITSNDMQTSLYIIENLEEYE